MDQSVVQRTRQLHESQRELGVVRHPADHVVRDGHDVRNGRRAGM